jgi:hypothetical protein
MNFDNLWFTIIKLRIENTEYRITSHKSQVTNHKSQITNHKSQITRMTNKAIYKLFKNGSDISGILKIKNINSEFFILTPVFS